MKCGLIKANSVLGSSATPLIPLPLIHSAASASAELVSCFILTPAEVLKQNAQMIHRPAAQTGSKASAAFQPSTSLEAFRHFKNPSHLWRGYTALAARNLPFTAMQFPMFEHLKTSIKEYRKRKGTLTGGYLETAIITSISAGSAGSVSAVVTTPIDLVKTRIMLSAAGESSEEEAKKQVERAREKGQTLDKLASEKGIAKKGSIAVAREILHESGIKGLFRGGTLRGAWTAIGSGLYLGVYELGRVWLGSRREVSHEN
jgi:solute carrier family 25 S-adenosylmethionine transporter 26